MRTWCRLILLMVLLPVVKVNAQGGFPPCTDPLGNPVPVVNSPGLQDVAYSTVQAGTPVILVNPNLAMTPGSYQAFAFFHECAHHGLGHILMIAHGQNPPMSAEVDADCVSIVQLAQMGLTNRDLIQIQQRMIPSPGGGRYPAGPVRANLLVTCLQSHGITNLPP